MLRRVFLYLVGVGLGVIVSIMFFGDRDIDFSYFPNARTVKHLRAQSFNISEKAMCQLTCLGLNASYFEKVFKDGDLDVDFGASDLDGMSHTYRIEVEDQSYASFIIDDCDSLSIVLSLETSTCLCE